VIAGAIVLAVLLSKRRQKKNNKPNNTEAVENLPLNQFSKKLLIPYKDLGFTKEIGAGSFGKVFIGEWRGVSVAIKMNNRLSSKDAESFLSEAKLTLQLPPHPNVVQTFGVSLDSEFPYIVLEFCNGGSLDKILSKQQQLTAAEQQTLVKGIAFGLLHLHSHNIVHRDLAARNILVGDHKPKISDFGMSRVLKDGAQQGQTASRLGPVRWMAPESIRDAVYSTKSDVWAFGIVGKFEFYCSQIS
jgi:serine/threonine protein kinase